MRYRQGAGPELTQQEKIGLIAFLTAPTGEPIKFELPKLPK
jgi:hypothetical protein